MLIRPHLEVPVELPNRMILDIWAIGNKFSNVTEQNVSLNSFSHVSLNILFWF